MPVRPEHIPTRFKARAQWALKRGKVPYQPNGRKAASTRAATWNSFETVWAAYAAGGWDGLYYAMTPADGVGIDEDHCIAADGTLSPAARALVDTFDTYVERSPSGDGLRLFLDGTLEHLVGRKKGPHECYNHARFLSITGHLVDDIARPIAPRQAALDAWHHAIWGAPASRAATVPPTPLTRLDDQDVLAKIRTARNGDTFAALYDHAPPAEDPRASEDDLALANRLAFYAPEPAQLRRLLDASARRRAKWETHRGTRTWLDVYVIDKALASLTATYRGGPTWDPATHDRARDIPVDGGGHNGHPLDAPAGDPALLAEIARLHAALEVEHAKRVQAEAFNSTLLDLLTNAYLRSEARLIVAEAVDYQKALRRGSVDSEGLAWLYIGEKTDTGLAGQAGRSGKTISRQLHRHATYEIDGQPLIDLVEDEVEGSDGNHRTRYRYKVPFLEQGGTVPALLRKLADYQPPGVADGARQTPGGNRATGRCDDCGGALEQTVTISQRVQRLEHSVITCLGCGTITDEGERVTRSETHQERYRRVRLDLPDLPRDPPEPDPDPAPDDGGHYGHRPDRDPAPDTGGHYGHPLDPDPAPHRGSHNGHPLEPNPALDSGGHYGHPLDRDPAPVPPIPAACVEDVRGPLCPLPAAGPDPVIMASVPPPPLPALPPGFDHWCPGAHPYPVPLLPRIARCTACVRPWRPPDDADPARWEGRP